MGDLEAAEAKHKAVDIDCGLRLHLADTDKVQFEVEPLKNDKDVLGVTLRPLRLSRKPLILTRRAIFYCHLHHFSVSRFFVQLRPLL